MPPSELPIDQLVESKSNPRTSFNPAKMAELVASVGQVGVIEPLVVRLIKSGKHEIIAGARRYRAAKTAELTVLPVRVLQLSDEQVLEIQLIENLQREDPHPMEEADGYQRLIAMGHTADELALKVGKDRSYIYKRIQLASLIKPAKTAFLEGRINIGHAILICRLPEPKQKLAFENCFESQWKGGKDVTETSGHADFSARELAQWIRQHLVYDLSAAPWKKDDATLVPKAGPCTLCPKRTGANAALFDDFKKGDQCLDGDCYEGKRDAFIKLTIKTEPTLPKISLSYRDQPKDFLQRDKYHAIRNDSDKCKYAQPALVAAGDDQVGSKILICAASDCKKHHQRSSYSSGGSSGGKKQTFAELWAERKRKLPSQIEYATRMRVMEQVLDRPLNWQVPNEALRVIALALLPFSTPIDVLKALKIPAAAGRDLKNGSAVSSFLSAMIDSPDGSPASDHLARIVMALTVQEIPKDYCPEPVVKRLKRAAESCGVEWASVAKKTSAEMTADFDRRKAKAATKKATAK